MDGLWHCFTHREMWRFYPSRSSSQSLPADAHSTVWPSSSGRTSGTPKCKMTSKNSAFCTRNTRVSPATSASRETRGLLNSSIYFKYMAISHSHIANLLQREATGRLVCLPGRVKECQGWSKNFRILKVYGIVDHFSCFVLWIVTDVLTLLTLFPCNLSLISFPTPSTSYTTMTFQLRKRVTQVPRTQRP